MQLKKIGTVMGTIFCGAVLAPVATAEPVGTSFTYRGQLVKDGVPVNDFCDFTFTLWNAEENGNQVGPVQALTGANALEVINGLFHAELDFGNVYAGQQLWLEQTIQCPDDVAAVTLAPRTKLGASPYALNTLGIVVDDEGQVGLGTQNPTKQLDIWGGLSLYDEQDEGVTMASSRFSFADLPDEDPIWEYRKLTDSHTFYTGGSGRLHIDSSGRVGIGKNNPGWPLDVNGTTQINGSLFFNTPGIFEVAHENNTGMRVDPETNTVHLESDNTPVLTALSSGEIGIGTQSPQADLHVRDNLFSEVLAEVPNGCWVKMVATATTGAVGTVTDHPFRLRTGNIERLTIDVDGNVGIGVNNPVNPLDVAGGVVIGAQYAAGGFGPTDGLIVQGNTGLGTTSPTNRLTVAGTANITGSLGIGTSSPGQDLEIESIQAVARLETTGNLNGSVLELRNNTANSNLLGSINFVASNGSTPGQIGYRRADNAMTFRTANSERMRIDASGLVGIGTSSPLADLHLSGGTGSASLLVEADTNNSGEDNQPSLFLSQDGGLVQGGLGFFDSSNQLRMRTLNPEDDLDIVLEPGDDVWVKDKLRLAHSENGVDGGQYSAYTGGGIETVVIDAEAGDGFGAEQRLRNAAGTSTIVLDAEDAEGGALVLIRDGGGNNTIILDADVPDGNGNPTNAAELRVRKFNGTDMESRIWMEAAHLENNADTGGRIRVRDSNNITRITLDAEDGIGGNATITTQVLEITGGSDLSERFDVATTSAAPEPGLVVSIDPANPGKLTVSNGAYDRTVAGIISGAGGVGTGMLMGQHGSVADGKHPVALTGRVYCYADTSAGAIKPGDLLTTSSTPGHAMKVADHDAAQGAILGKAMTALDDGTGLVLVLVALQ